MSSQTTKIIRFAGFGFLTLLLILVTFVTFMSYTGDPTQQGYLAFAVRNHVTIMAILLIVAIAFGFVSSSIYNAQIKKAQQETRNVLDIVLLFLNRDERAIISVLVQNRGSTNQAEIARLPGMNRVKAFRSLQKMQEKQLIEILAHGKVRKINLKENLLTMLTEHSK